MIYYVEDDSSIRNLIIYTLGMTGFEAKGFETPEEFYHALETQAPDLILLDIMLPQESGLSILRRLKSHQQTMHLPVIMITAKDSEDDIVSGLEIGADDYISKPLSMMELIARIKAVLRRSAAAVPEILCTGNICMDTGRHIVTSSDREVVLTLKEYKLLRALLSNPEHVIDREKLINTVWSYNYTGANHTLDSHIQTLRSKLEPNGGQIHTVYGRGYKICAEAKA